MSVCDSRGLENADEVAADLDQVRGGNARSSALA